MTATGCPLPTPGDSTTTPDDSTESLPQNSSSTSSVVTRRFSVTLSSSEKKTYSTFLPWESRTVGIAGLKWKMPPDLPSEDEDVYCWREDEPKRALEKRHLEEVARRCKEKDEREFNRAWEDAYKVEECRNTYEDHAWMLKYDSGDMRVACGICDYPHEIHRTEDWQSYASFDLPVTCSVEWVKTSYWENEWDCEIDIQERTSEPKGRTADMDGVQRDRQGESGDGGATSRTVARSVS